MMDNNFLLAPQILNSCRLALPEGLKDLMSDISREVLRHQPEDLYLFITNYLRALLVARDNLFVASKLCSEICKCSCRPELNEDFRNIGLSEKDIEKAENIVYKYFEQGGDKEENLIMKLARNTDIDETVLIEVHEAVQKYYLKHRADCAYKELSSLNTKEYLTQAAYHTLELYKEPLSEEEDESATKIQAVYHGHAVKKNLKPSITSQRDEDNKKKAVRMCENGPARYEVDELFTSTAEFCPMTTVSSTSLAGSLMRLPKYEPYSPHHHRELTNEKFDELAEKESSIVNYDELKSKDETSKPINYDKQIMQDKEFNSQNLQTEKISALNDDQENIQEETLEHSNNGNIEEVVDDASQNLQTEKISALNDDQENIQEETLEHSNNVNIEEVVDDVSQNLQTEKISALNDDQENIQEETLEHSNNGNIEEVVDDAAVLADTESDESLIAEDINEEFDNEQDVILEQLDNAEEIQQSDEEQFKN